VSDRGELAIVALVFAAAACALAAPLLGRAGAPGLAGAAMALAAACGTASFAVAAVHTWRAARRRSGPGAETRAEGGDA
jgi:uncharacterized membrane protein YebE (DUF533 family)